MSPSLKLTSWASYRHRKLRGRDNARAAELHARVDTILVVLDVVPPTPMMRGRSTTGWRDAMIAAAALVHSFIVVTRNTKDFLDFGVPLLDPFAPP